MLDVTAMSIFLVTADLPCLLDLIWLSGRWDRAVELAGSAQGIFDDLMVHPDRVARTEVPAHIVGALVSDTVLPARPPRTA